MGESPEELIELENAIEALNEEIHNLEKDPKKVEDEEKVKYICSHNVVNSTVIWD
jgi:hypothetical protein